MLPWIFAILLACSGRRNKDGTEQPYDPPDDDSPATSGSDEGTDDTGQPTGGDDSEPDSPQGGDDTHDTGPDTGPDTSMPSTPRGWTVVELAPLAGLSDGDCPDFSDSGTSKFTSSGEDRTVTLLLPDTDGDDEVETEGAPVVFFFHGLTTPEESSEPSRELAEALDLQGIADETGAIIVVPEAPLREMYDVEFYLWQVDSVDSTDLTLYDDLRTCLSSRLDVDLERVTAVGFSGGALFTTVLLAERGDTLATFVELSGGADVDVPLFTDPFAPYSTPAWTLPGLVVSGGATDVWPSVDAPLVDFEDASDTLTDELVTDSSFVVRCHHDEGHSITWDEYLLTISWLTTHQFGQPSPFAGADLGADADWCVDMGG